MNKVLLFLALSIGLQANCGQSMEQAQKADLFAAIKNSPAAQWINKHKTLILVLGACGIIGFTAGCYYANRPEQVKHHIKKIMAERVAQETLELRDRHRSNASDRFTLLRNNHRYCGFTIKIVVNTNQENKPKYLIEYRYNCDNTTETGEIFFENDQGAQAPAINSLRLINQE